MKKLIHIGFRAALAAAAAWALVAGAWAAEAPALDDESVTAAVERELAADPAVPAHLITVEASNGIVSLKGRIGNLLAKERAADIAETVKGVRTVVNRVLVIPAVRRPDAELASDVRRALENHPVVEAGEVEVRVKNGTAHLSGTVDSWPEYRFCERAAKSVKGVIHVRNDIRVDFAARRADDEIRAEVVERLRWDALVDDGLIRVGVTEGVVVLRGTVGSAAEKARAVYDAYVAGVASVDASGLGVARWARDPELREGKYVFKSDAEIEKAVLDAFRYDPRVSSFDVQVEASKGEVTLRGTVDTIGARRAAAQDARHTVGVRSVDNRIEVRPPGPYGASGAGRRVWSAVSRDPYLDSGDMLLSVSDGTARLFGRVRSNFEKRRAEDVVAGVAGITKVENNLVVEDAGPLPSKEYAGDPSPGDYEWYRPAMVHTPKSDARLRRDIEEELWWSPYVNAERVHVEVRRGRAILTGDVDSLREKSAAGRNAFEAGATDVRNDLKVRVH